MILCGNRWDLECLSKIKTVTKEFYMKWISLLVLFFTTSVIAESILIEWELEILMQDGTYAYGMVYLNQDGDLIGTLRTGEEGDGDYVQVYGNPSDETLSLYGGNIAETAY